jgi:rhodanese-related sulfurtransferase
MKLLARMLILLLVAATLAAAANTLLPNAIPWKEDWDSRVEAKALQEGITLVSLAQTQQFARAGTHVIFDARPPADFEAGHLPQAISLPSQHLTETFPQVQLLIRPDTPIIVYCSGQQCDESLTAARFLREQGYRNVSLFAEGFTAWQKAGLKIEVGQ